MRQGFLKSAKSFWLVLAVMAMQTAQEVSANVYQGSTAFWVYVGTASYSGGPSKTLYLCSFDVETGKLELVGLAAETDNPGFLAVHPTKPYLYAVNEIGHFRGRETGAVSSFRIERESGRLTFLNQVPSLGANPSYVTVNRAGTFVVVASYYGGTITLAIRDDGSLGEAAARVQESGVGVNPVRQESSHPHSVVLSPDNRFAIAVDLGLDRLFVYKLDARKGSLTANRPAFGQAGAGSGPRHLAFAPNGRFAYVINELQSSLSTYAYKAQAGTFHLLQTISTLPAGFKEANSGAEVQVAPSGRFVYASNRGEDSIAVFAVDPSTGRLTTVQDVPTQGKTPRNFVLDPSGKFLLVGNQDSGQIVVFRVDQLTGHLTPTGEKLDVSSPVCMTFVASLNQRKKKVLTTVIGP